MTETRLGVLLWGQAAAWSELEAECGEELVVRTGDLTFGALASESAQALASCGVRHELLTGTQAAARWPIAARATEQVLFQPDGGTSLADRAHAALRAGHRWPPADRRA